MKGENYVFMQKCDCKWSANEYEIGKRNVGIVSGYMFAGKNDDT